MTRILRWRYPILVLLSAASAYAMRLAPQRRIQFNDWIFFAKGSQLLFGSHPAHLSPKTPGGLHLYANYPAVQIGPLVLLLVAPFRFLFGIEGSRAIAVVFLTLLAPLILWVLERAAMRSDDNEGDVPRRQWFVLVAGAAVVMQWAWLGSRYSHLDDGVVLLFMAVVLWAVARDRPMVVGVAVAVAVAAKPWGVIFLPLLLVLHGRDRWKAIAVSMAGIGAAWLPFVLADRRTLSAGKPAIVTAPGSVVHLLGAAVGSSPGWVRPTQIGLGVLLGSLLVRRGEWFGVPLLAIGIRVLLDPGTFAYYTSGLLVAAFAWEILRSPRPVPALTPLLLVLFEIPARVDVRPGLEAVLRFSGCFLAIGMAFLGERASSSAHSLPRSRATS